ncbi:MAG TPA: hypothetical protein VGG65_10400 [Thermoanaerobaculia bacterium]
MNRTRGGPLRLVKSLRGEGTLMWGRGSAREVSYSIDLYGQGPLLSGDGDVRGNLADLVGRSPANVRLRLASGHEAPITLCGIEADSASIDLVKPASPALFEDET